MKLSNVQVYTSCHLQKRLRIDSRVPTRSEYCQTQRFCPWRFLIIYQLIVANPRIRAEINSCHEIIRCTSTRVRKRVENSRVVFHSRVPTRSEYCQTQRFYHWRFLKIYQLIVSNPRIRVEINSCHEKNYPMYETYEKRLRIGLQFTLESQLGVNIAKHKDFTLGDS